MNLSAPALERLRFALECSKCTGGSTHNFYLYPARFSPQIARAVIETFSNPGDWILDPFMGGGTTVVEGLTSGRRVIGVDLNALGHFVANVRTRPLSGYDEEVIREWAGHAKAAAPDVRTYPHVHNLPKAVGSTIAGALAGAERLPFPRQRAFARCALLRLGQWALDCRDDAGPSRGRFADRLPELVDEMLAGLREFVERCRTAGLGRRDILRGRYLLCRTSVGLHEELRLRNSRPRLVFTSPPYPRVHVLYHRWQVRGRRETAAPYWIAQVPDGFFASHYTGGSRTPTGEQNYFAMIREAFSSVRQVLAEDGLVVQLVGFADTNRQLPKYLTTMAEAGFEAWRPAGTDHLWRGVPNRKWYAKLQGAVDASSEVLLFHRPRRHRSSI